MLTASPDPQLRLAADRADFERLVARRFAGVLSHQDAEDVVSDALIDAAPRCPAGAADGGRAWFTRVCLNGAQDLRRSREGRPRSARGPRPAGAPPTARRFLALDDPSLRDLASGDERPEEVVERRLDREDARRRVTRALASIDAADAELLRRRHLGAAEQPRELVAAALGVSLAAFEVKATRARRALTAALREQQAA